MYAGCSNSTQVAALNSGVGNVMLFGIDPWNWLLCSLESDSLPRKWFLCSLEFNSLPWKCVLCSLESAYRNILEVAVKKERGRAEKRPSDRLRALDNNKKRERASSSEKNDEEGSGSSNDERIDSKDAKRNSGRTESSKDTKHAKEPKPVKNAGAKRRGAEEAEHGKDSKKNRRVEEDDEEDETPKKSKAGKAAVITPEKQEGARCMQCWVVCRLWILETDVSDVLGAVMCLTFSELLNPCSWLSLDRHML